MGIFHAWSNKTLFGKIKIKWQGEPCWAHLSSNPTFTKEAALKKQILTFLHVYTIYFPLCASACVHACRQDASVISPTCLKYGNSIGYMILKKLHISHWTWCKQKWMLVGQCIVMFTRNAQSKGWLPWIINLFKKKKKLGYCLKYDYNHYFWQNN